MVALQVLRCCSQVAEDTGNTPHGLLRLRIAIDMLCKEMVVMLSPFLSALIIAEMSSTFFAVFYP